MPTGQLNSFCEVISSRRLKIKLQTGDEGSFPREFEIVGKGIQLVIAIANIQDSQPDFRMAIGEAISDIGVELPEIVAGQSRRVTTIGLGVPKGIHLAEKTTAQITDGVQIQLVQSGFAVLVESRQSWSARGDLDESSVDLGRG